MLQFEVAEEGTSDCAILAVRGELDIATAPVLVEALERTSQRDPGRIVVNLLDTTFVDSTGLTTLLRMHRQFESNGGDFSLVCAPDNLEVRRIIDLMGFDAIFVIHESLAAAGCED